MSIVWTPPLLDCGLDEATLWNAILELSGQAIPLGEDGASLTFALREPPPVDSWLAALETERGTILAHVRDFPFRAMFNVELTANDLGCLPDGLRQALLEGIFASIRALAALSAEPGFQVTAQGLAPTFPEFARSDAQWIAVCLTRPDGLTVDLDLCCARALVVKLLAGRASAASGGQAAIASKLRIPVEVTIGSITVTRGTMNTLQPGAVVVMAERPADTLWLRIQTSLYPFAKAEEEGWRCAGRQSIEEYRSDAVLYRNLGGMIMNQESEGTEAEERPVSTADLRIPIDFDIGRMTMPLSEISKWREGALVVFEPPLPADGLQVNIRANGDLIGSGDVVHIDDRLAVRIKHLLLQS